MKLLRHITNAVQQVKAVTNFCAVCGFAAASEECHCPFLDGWTDPEITPHEPKNS